RRHTRSKRDWSSDVCSSDLVELADNDVFVLEKLIERTARQLRTLRDFLARERLETRFDQHLPGHRQQVIEFLLATLLRGSPARLEYFDAHGPHPSVLLARRRKSSVDEREHRVAYPFKTLAERLPVRMPVMDAF